MIEPHIDEKRYQLFDTVKAGSGDCRNCSACCENMGESIRLDPRDLFYLCNVTGLTFEGLLEKHIELHVVDGMILPNLKMDEKTNQCSFLMAHRCSIHKDRPGLCRLFPLGRNYEAGKMDYILLKDTCGRQMEKVKVSEWLGVEHVTKYHDYLVDWHYFVKDCQNILQEMTDDEMKTKVNMYLLHTFYQNPYQSERDFYEQFYERLAKIREAFLQ